jgi:hypothetical protein
VAGGRWLHAEGAFGGTSWVPTPLIGPGVKQSLLVEANGVPLAITIANVPDSQPLEATIDAIVLERPEPAPDCRHAERR